MNLHTFLDFSQVEEYTIRLQPLKQFELNLTAPPHPQYGALIIAFCDALFLILFCAEISKLLLQEIGYSCCG